MHDKKLMNQVGINEKILKAFYEFCVDAELNLSFREHLWNPSGIEKLIQNYFPYIMIPSARERLKFLENNLISGESLDAGCGTGWVDFWLIKKGKNKIDIKVGDLSDNSLKQTKIVFDFFNIQKDPIKFDMTCLPFPNENFDNVICFSVLEHVPSLELAIKEFYRVLKPNGRLIIALPNETGCYSLINDRFGPAFLSMIGRPISKGIESYHEHLHGFGWWKNIIEKNGFDYIDSTNIEFLTPLFSFSASLLKINRAKIYRLAFVDDKISKYLPKFMASDWMMSFEKKKEAMKKKVFLLHNIISPYRLPLFEKLSEEFDLDVKFCKAISKDRLWSTKLKGYSFKNEILRNITIGPIVINYSSPFKLLSNEYDVYIVGGGVETLLSGFVVLLISKLFKKPFIVWSGEIVDYGHDDSWFKKVMRRCYHILNKKLLYPFTDSFIAYGEVAKDFLVNNGVPEEKIFIGTQVISNAQLKRVEISKKDFGFPNKKVILFLSYFYKRKGGDVLIKAFKKMKRKDTILIMAGAGEEENSFKSLSEGAKNIYFPGYISGKEKAKYYSIADIFVLPTFWDPWGLVINEAMILGLPIIVTENAGCSKELIDGNGYVVKAGDEEGLRVAIEKILNDDELREKMGMRSKEIIKKYNADYAVNAFMNAVEYATRTK